MTNKTYTISIEIDGNGRITKVTTNGIQVEPARPAMLPFLTKCEQNDDGTCTKHVFDGANEVYSYTVPGPCPPGCPKYLKTGKP